VLVLRRRAHESIVFEGGLLITLVEVTDHRAWLAFSSPTIPTPVVVAALAVGHDTACIGIRSPATITRSGTVTHVGLDASGVEQGDAPVLLVNKSAGERIVLAGLTLEVSSLDQGRVVLEATVAEMAGGVGVSVFSVSGAEVKIGIDAPEDIRVYREEVWLAMHAENQRAATWSASDLESLGSAPR